VELPEDIDQLFEADLGGIEFDIHELCMHNNSGGVQIFAQAWTRWQAQEPIDSWSVTASSRLK
jgi:hypothetical protein